jgi:hypothetical protein
MNKNKKSKSKVGRRASAEKLKSNSVSALWNEFVEGLARRARLAGFAPPDVPPVNVKVPEPPKKEEKMKAEVPATQWTRWRALPPQPKPDFVQPYTPQTDAARLDFTLKLRTLQSGMPVRFIGIVDSLESGNVGLAMHPDGRERVICFDDFGRAPLPGGSTIQIVNTLDNSPNDEPYSMNWHATTKVGERVRIFCFDRKGSCFPVVGTVRRDGDKDTVNVWTHSGKFTSDARGHDDDLAPGWDGGLQCGQLRERELEETCGFCCSHQD